jgi:hypothetical protein
MNFKPNSWTVLCFTGLASHQLVADFVRPNYGMGEGLLPFLLGVAPNFLAAALIFPFFGLMAMHHTKPDIRHRHKRWFYISLIISQAGLLVWEYMQQFGKLVFDLNDVAATVVGGIVAVILYKIVAPSTWNNSQLPSDK